MDENKDINQGLADEEKGSAGTGEKTYTVEEVNKLLQAEADRRVSSALAKQKKEYEKKLNLAGLDEAQREKAESQMRQTLKKTKRKNIVREAKVNITAAIAITTDVITAAIAVARTLGHRLLLRRRHLHRSQNQNHLNGTNQSLNKVN